MRYISVPAASIDLRLMIGFHPISEVSAFKVAHHTFGLLEKSLGSSSFATFLQDNVGGSDQPASHYQANNRFLEWMEYLRKYGITFSQDEINPLYRCLLWLDGAVRNGSRHENALILTNRNTGLSIVFIARTWTLRDPSRSVMTEGNASAERDYYKRLYERFQRNWFSHISMTDRFGLRHPEGFRIVSFSCDKA